MQLEIMLCEQGYECSLETDHAANEGIDQHEQCELLPICSQTQTDRIACCCHTREASRFVGVPYSTGPPAWRHSSTPSARSARL